MGVWQLYRATKPITVVFSIFPCWRIIQNTQIMFPFLFISMKFETFKCSAVSVFNIMSIYICTYSCWCVYSKLNSKPTRWISCHTNRQWNDRKSVSSMETELVEWNSFLCLKPHPCYSVWADRDFQWKWFSFAWKHTGTFPAHVILSLHQNTTLQ